VFHFSAGFFWCKKRTPGRGPWGLTVKRMGASASTDVPGQQGDHEVRLAATEIIRVAGMSGYHTSILLDGREYFFDAIGILEAAPLFSHTLNEAKNPDGSKTMVVPVGYSHCSAREMVDFLQEYFLRG
ncbi:unnamed protein product, partial [Effrenium voratum]